MTNAFALTVFAASAAWAADAVPMDVKTGQWETTVSSRVSGVQIPAIPPEQLARMPADQRARLEAMMKQAGNNNTTTKSCIKKEDLTKLQLNNDQNCKSTLVSSSKTKQELHLECERNGNKQTATMTIEAQGPESVKFAMQASNEGTANMNMTMTGSSKWLGPDCAPSK